MFQYTMHVFFWLTHRKTTHSITIKTDFRQAFYRYITQIFIHTTLHDTKQVVRVFELIEVVTRTFCPTQRHFHRFFRFIVGRWVWRTLVKNHHDV
ncbi:Uncharacterised protein [Vibrio cholerae]|nr:Uncharacterised protein [Vibrio cholerae]